MAGFGLAGRGLDRGDGREVTRARSMIKTGGWASGAMAAEVGAAFRRVIGW
jgi:hypothetical protein